jgi:hypothetical protein
MEFREFLETQEKMDESLWGLAKGGWNTFAGAMTMGDEAIAKFVGDGTRGRFRRGGKQFARGVRQILIGDPPKEEPARQDPAPAQPAPIQPKPEAKATRERQPAPRQSTPAAKATRERQPAPEATQADQPNGRPLQPGEPRPNARWLELSKNYRTARESGNKAVTSHIEFLMSQADPVYYDYAVRQARLRKKSRKA